MDSNLLDNLESSKKKPFNNPNHNSNKKLTYTRRRSKINLLKFLGGLTRSNNPSIIINVYKYNSIIKILLQIYNLKELTIIVSTIRIQRSQTFLLL